MKWSKGLAGIAWAILAVMLITGLTIHSNDWQSYWALWSTEVLSMAIIAMYFYRPSKITGITMLIGNLIWLINQLMCWYFGELTHTTFVQSMLTLQYVYIVTFSAEITLLIVAYLSTASKRNVEEGEGKWIAATGLGIMLLFSIAKIVTLYRSWAVFGGFVPGTDVANSAYSWGIGILIMSIGSLVAVLSHEDSGSRRVGGYIALIGLVIGTFAALYYGLALAILGLP